MEVTLTRKQLSEHDGVNKPAYVAVAGNVYDVSGSFSWEKGLHQVVHKAGTDLTEALEKAPHDASLLERFPVVARLVEEDVIEPRRHQTA